MSPPASFRSKKRTSPDFSPLVLVLLLCLAGCGHSFPSDDSRSLSYEPLRKLLVGGQPLDVYLRQRTAVLMGSTKDQHSVTSLAIAIDKRGYFLTAAHCLQGTKFSLVFRTDTGVRSISPRIVATAKEHDIAIIHVDAAVPQVFEWSDISGLKAGGTAASVGETKQVRLSEGLTASRPICFSGRIVATAASEDGAVEIFHDLPLRPGDSGGPLANTDGKLLGLNSLLLVEWSGRSTGVAVRPNQRWVTDIIEADVSRAISSIRVGDR